MHPHRSSQIHKKHTTDSSEDTEYLILSRISSLQTLDRCKSVCKSWYKIINEVPFMPSYCQNTGNLYGFLLQVWKYKFIRNFSKVLVSINRDDNNNYIPVYAKFDDEFVGAACVHKGYKKLKFDDEVEILAAASMQGIVCCAVGKQLYVCKPTTGQWTPIPSPSRSERDVIGLMLCSIQPLKYKIIWISSTYRVVNRSYEYLYETYDSTTLKWSNSVELLLPFSQSRFNQEQGIQVGKFLYFLMDTLILACCGDHENIFQISLPEPVISFEGDVHSTIFRRKLIEYKGKLGLLCTTWPGLSFVQMWILDDRQETWMWNKIKEVDLSYLNLRSVHPVGFYSADILVLRGSKSLIFCNFHNSTYKELQPINFGYKCEIFPFRSDWEFADCYRSVVDLYKHAWWGDRKFGTI